MKVKPKYWEETEDRMIDRMDYCKRVLKCFSNYQYPHYLTICRKPNYCGGDVIEEHLDDELNDTLIKIIQAYYEKELKYVKDKLKEQW